MYYSKEQEQELEPQWKEVEKKRKGKRNYDVIMDGMGWSLESVRGEVERVEVVRSTHTPKSIVLLKVWEGEGILLSNIFM